MTSRIGMCVGLWMAGMLTGRVLAGIIAVPASQAASRPAQNFLTRHGEEEMLLVRYLKCVNKLERLVLVEREGVFKEAAAKDVARIAQLAKDEAQVLRGLREERSKRGAGKLDCEGEVYENGNPFVYGSSPASARIVRALMAEAAFRDFGDVIAQLVCNSSRELCREWVSLLEDGRRIAGKDSVVWHLAARLLYLSGQLGYREELLDQVEVHGNVAALEAVLFRMDVQTGMSLPVITVDNLRIMRRYSEVTSPPEIRALCACFALDLRDFELSARICRDLLDQAYRGLKDVTALAPKEDLALFRARQTAMRLMFYGHKNEDSFRLIYSRAHIEEQERRRRTPIRMRPLPPRSPTSAPAASEMLPSQADEYWVSFTAYSLGRFEVSLARSLLSAIGTASEEGDNRED